MAMMPRSNAGVLDRVGTLDIGMEQTIIGKVQPMRTDGITQERPIVVFGEGIIT